MRVKVIGDGPAAKELRHMILGDRDLQLATFMPKVTIGVTSGKGLELRVGKLLSPVEVEIIKHLWLRLPGAFALKDGGVEDDSRVDVQHDTADETQHALLPRAIYAALIDYARSSKSRWV